ncbi:MAG: DMT family transporter [Rhodospirillales bacterium]|nr:MAG: DMT family transporter [Rhodospirillales bacterium]
MPPSIRVPLAWAMLLAMPAFFAVNQLAARWVDFVPPHALALGRWALASLFLLPFVGATLWRQRAAAWREAPYLLVLGALGMWVCGAFVYIGGRETTATNIALIYAASPVGIVVIARLFLGERLSWVRAAGVALCLAGLLLIIVKGEPWRLGAVRFSTGDLWVAVAASCWAAYSVLLKRWPTAFDPTARLALISAAGCVVLLPFTVAEAALVGPPRIDGATLLTWVTLAIVPGIGAYACFAFCLRELGAGRAAVGMYLGPLYTVAMAWALLDEAPRWYHIAGAGLVLPGVFLATRAPKG